ncbi:ferredoxin-thioredoxin reductase catalytic domain-containing protein [Desulfosediminicola ganghwensis]|uniref:ferredoxin-thioredoxin reductase catalytic domain-containing protein n=1 Tax=Desulfosediminicola ganghwensis TaxID=2569540 RepID=UPI0010ABF1AA|nr:ferredoxin-thioredoxin reductase catalytic domain-containing protein [Desulfosediminicola ganghwensis]
MNSETLYRILKKTNEPKGYFFNRDRKITMELLEGLLTNKARYGYMCCPCRMAQEDVEKDRDIICPCDYREDDVQEFGSCYCGLYVSRNWNDGVIEHTTVPERRPAEKC